MDKKFSYTYSPSRNAEVEDIRRKYLPSVKTDERLEKLRMLDRKCERPGMWVSILIGICGTVILIIGMILMFSSERYALGILLGIAGLAVMSSALPVFGIITQKRRRLYAAEILKLSEEIGKDPSV